MHSSVSYNFEMGKHLHLVPHKQKFQTNCLYAIYNNLNVLMKLWSMYTLLFVIRISIAIPARDF